VPTYQYACTACGHQLETVQSFADEPLSECPACEGRLRKLFSSVGVVFKGSGFYRTDSRAKPTESTSSESSKSTESSKPAETTKSTESTKTPATTSSSSTPSTTAA
jgi:putative FmdB family regulatory protein